MLMLTGTCLARTTEMILEVSGEMSQETRTAAGQQVSTANTADDETTSTPEDNSRTEPTRQEHQQSEQEVTQTTVAASRPASEMTQDPTLTDEQRQMTTVAGTEAENTADDTQEISTPQRNNENSRSESTESPAGRHSTSQGPPASATKDTATPQRV